MSDMTPIERHWVANELRQAASTLIERHDLPSPRARNIMADWLREEANMFDVWHDGEERSCSPSARRLANLINRDLR